MNSEEVFSNLYSIHFGSSEWNIEGYDNSEYDDIFRNPVDSSDVFKGISLYKFPIPDGTIAPDVSKWKELVQSTVDNSPNFGNRLSTLDSSTSSHLKLSRDNDIVHSGNINGPSSFKSSSDGICEFLDLTSECADGKLLKPSSVKQRQLSRLNLADKKPGSTMSSTGKITPLDSQNRGPPWKSNDKNNSVHHDASTLGEFCSLETNNLSSPQANTSNFMEDQGGNMQNQISVGNKKSKSTTSPTNKTVNPSSKGIIFTKEESLVSAPGGKVSSTPGRTELSSSLQPSVSVSSVPLHSGELSSMIRRPTVTSLADESMGTSNTFLNRHGIRGKSSRKDENDSVIGIGVDYSNAFDNSDSSDGRDGDDSTASDSSSLSRSPDTHESSVMSRKSHRNSVESNPLSGGSGTGVHRRRKRRDKEPETVYVSQSLLQSRSLIPSIFTDAIASQFSSTSFMIRVYLPDFARSSLFIRVSETATVAQVIADVIRIESYLRRVGLSNGFTPSLNQPPYVPQSQSNQLPTDRNRSFSMQGHRGSTNSLNVSSNTSASLGTSAIFPRTNSGGSLNHSMSGRSTSSVASLVVPGSAPVGGTTAQSDSSSGNPPLFGQWQWPVVPEVLFYSLLLHESNGHPDEDFPPLDQGHFIRSYGSSGAEFCLVVDSRAQTAGAIDDWLLSHLQSLPYHLNYSAAPERTKELENKEQKRRLTISAMTGLPLPLSQLSNSASTSSLNINPPGTPLAPGTPLHRAASARTRSRALTVSSTGLTLQVPFPGGVSFSNRPEGLTGTPPSTSSQAPLPPPLQMDFLGRTTSRSLLPRDSSIVLQTEEEAPVVSSYRGIYGNLLFPLNPRLQSVPLLFTSSADSSPFDVPVGAAQTNQYPPVVAGSTNGGLAIVPGAAMPNASISSNPVPNATANYSTSESIPPPLTPSITLRPLRVTVLLPNQTTKTIQVPYNLRGPSTLKPLRVCDVIVFVGRHCKLRVHSERYVLRLSNSELTRKVKDFSNRIQMINSGLLQPNGGGNSQYSGSQYPEMVSFGNIHNFGITIGRGGLDVPPLLRELPPLLPLLPLGITSVEMSKKIMADQPSSTLLTRSAASGNPNGNLAGAEEPGFYLNEQNGSNQQLNARATGKNTTGPNEDGLKWRPPQSLYFSSGVDSQHAPGHPSGLPSTGGGLGNHPVSNSGKTGNGGNLSGENGNTTGVSRSIFSRLSLRDPLRQAATETNEGKEKERSGFLSSLKNLTPARSQRSASIQLQQQQTTNRTNSVRSSLANSASQTAQLHPSDLPEITSPSSTAINEMSAGGIVAVPSSSRPPGFDSVQLPSAGSPERSSRRNSMSAVDEMSDFVGEVNTPAPIALVSKNRRSMSFLGTPLKRTETNTQKNNNNNTPISPPPRVNPPPSETRLSRLKSFSSFSRRQDVENGPQSTESSAQNTSNNVETLQTPPPVKKSFFSKLSDLRSRTLSASEPVWIEGVSNGTSVDSASSTNNGSDNAIKTGTQNMETAANEAGLRSRQPSVFLRPLDTDSVNGGSAAPNTTASLSNTNVATNISGMNQTVVGLDLVSAAGASTQQALQSGQRGSLRRSEGMEDEEYDGENQEKALDDALNAVFGHGNGTGNGRDVNHTNTRLDSRNDSKTGLDTEIQTTSEPRSRRNTQTLLQNRDNRGLSTSSNSSNLNQTASTMNQTAVSESPSRPRRLFSFSSSSPLPSLNNVNSADPSSTASSTSANLASLPTNNGSNNALSVFVSTQDVVYHRALSIFSSPLPSMVLQMSAAAAGALVQMQEPLIQFSVIKINARGRRQERLFGISQLFVTNRRTEKDIFGRIGTQNALRSLLDIVFIESATNNENTSSVVDITSGDTGSSTLNGQSAGPGSNRKLIKDDPESHTRDSNSNRDLPFSSNLENSVSTAIISPSSISSPSALVGQSSAPTSSKALQPASERVYHIHFRRPKESDSILSKINIGNTNSTQLSSPVDSKPEAENVSGTSSTTLAPQSPTVAGSGSKSRRGTLFGDDEDEQSVRLTYEASSVEEKNIIIDLLNLAIHRLRDFKDRG